ncbi:MAG: hypothetical protein KIG68_09460 [Oxalobacter sp.]|nr:hypothetical protein [Oxalobacter sp.]
MQNPDVEVREWCLSLAQAETGCGCLEWFDVPIMELSHWAEAVNRMAKKRKRMKKQ